MNIVRLIFLSIVLTSLAVTSIQAETFKLTHQWPKGDGRDTGARQFAEEVSSMDSSIKFRIYPGASLISSPVAQLDALQKGTIDLSVFPLVYGVGKIPELSATILPGAVNSVEDAVSLKGSAFHEQLQAVAERNGFHILTWWWTEGGVANKIRPIKGPDTVDGLDMRGADRTIDSMLSAAGASVISMPSTELYSALQTGVLDGLMTSYESLMSMRLYEQTSYATIGGEYSMFVLLQPLVVSMDVWKGLTPDQQRIFEEAAAKTEKDFLEEQLKIKESTVEKFKAAGVDVRQMTEEEHTQWLTLAKDVAWKEFAEISPEARKLIDALEK